MGYVDLGFMRLERDLVVLCDCRRDEATSPLTGVRVLLHVTPGEVLNLRGTCRMCGTTYALGFMEQVERGQRYEAERAALAVVADTP